MKLTPSKTLSRMLRAREISWKNLGRRIYFYIPSFSYYRNKYYEPSSTSFPSISVTGSLCSLNCRHCEAKLLKTMIPARTPEELLRVCSEIKGKGAVGCLISGGCLPDGSVPISRFTDAIAEIKNRLGLTIVVHTGLIGLETAEMLRKACVDVVSVDIIGSNETIRKVYNLDASIRDYEKTLEALDKSGIPFTPHILVGIHYGHLKGEMMALRMISKHKPSAIIIIAFSPIKGTLMEDVKPPPPRAIVKVLIEARFMMPNLPIALGCARPKGKHRVETDLLAVEAGVNAIAFPSLEAIERARELGLEIKFSPLCCSQIYRDLEAEKLNF